MRFDEFHQLLPTTNSTCYWCQLDVHEECTSPADEMAEGWFACCCRGKVERIDSSPGGGEVKTEGFKDPISTGRKRAAMLYPIWAGMVCEWSGLRSAGGGPEPIVGCNGNLIFPTKDGTQGNVHHGPDKSVMNNGPLNVHRICRSCHSLWHARNNRYYTEPRPEQGEPWLPSAGVTSLLHMPDVWADPDVLVAESVGRETVNPRVADPTRRGVIPEVEWIV